MRPRVNYHSAQGKTDRTKLFQAKISNAEFDDTDFERHAQEDFAFLFILNLAENSCKSFLILDSV